MAKAKKISRKKLKEPDEFITFSSKLLTFVLENKKPIIGSAALIVVLIAAFFFIQYMSHRSEIKAFELLNQTLKNYSERLQEKGADQAFSDAEKEFEILLTKYSNKNAAKLGRVIIANLNYYNNRIDEAIALFKKALEDFDHNPFYKNMILSSLGYAYEKKENYNEAVKYFDMIANGADPVMKSEAIFNLGRLYALMGDEKKSVEAYKKIESDYADSIYFNLAREKTP
jgi:tetratricopeptide (TPR) repeat protein